MIVDKQYRITIPLFIRNHLGFLGNVNVYLLGDWENDQDRVSVLLSKNFYDDDEHCWISQRNVDSKGRTTIKCVFDFLSKDPKPEDYDILIYMKKSEVYLLCKRIKKTPFA